jgi:hypothetical protein
MTNKTIGVTRLRDLIIIKKENESEFFTSSSNSFIISVPNFAALLKFMLNKSLLSPKVLEGVLDEFKNRGC